MPRSASPGLHRGQLAEILATEMPIGELVQAERRLSVTQQAQLHTSCSSSRRPKPEVALATSTRRAQMARAPTPVRRLMVAEMPLGFRQSGAAPHSTTVAISADRCTIL